MQVQRIKRMAWRRRSNQSAATDLARLSDAELVAQCRDDLAQFVPLYDRYVVQVYRYCRKSLLVAQAEDVTRVTFMKALAALPRLSPGEPTNFRGWLFTIAHNVEVD